MCDRTVKMKLKKGAILQEVNSNTNSIELNVKGIDTKAFGRHVDILPPDVKNQKEWVKRETESNKVENADK
jgi:hypothetical protein